ncbi:hypothetical protein L6R50_22100 [Myxococcota bacterium]|nr:hypothetical protein [Myxococcota bacterium]
MIAGPPEVALPPSALPFGLHVEMRVETPRGAFVKRDLVGGRLRIAFVSPWPCPFDYGHVPGWPARDGLFQDAAWIGPRARPLDMVAGTVAAVVRFTDGGLVDDKWIVSPDGEIPSAEVSRIRRFFRLYAAVKSLRKGGAAFGGLDVSPHVAGGRG